MRARVPALALGASLAVAAVLAAFPPRAAPAVAHDLRRIRIEASRGTTILVHGTYPVRPSRCVDPPRLVLHARFRGAIEVGRDTDGSLFVVGELPFEEYLKGIAEVPRTWPMEALKAQVVAARSYALARLERGDATGDHFGYDLCSTDACQVYRGMGIEDGPWGKRWVEAVEATSGEALVYGGRPAETLYFSTSNGHTFGNDQVFGSDPLPYLRPVPERDDGASPVSRWTVTMPLGDVSRFLRDAGLWSGPDIRTVTDQGNRLVLTGGGRTEAVSPTDFRLALNDSAPCLEPSSYPASGLPQTVPSKWFLASTEGGSVRLEGRGWGHGVGMVQWGAYGKALGGLSYRDILSYYYGGLRPVAFDEPETIRVGIAVGLTSVRIAPSGPVEVTGRRLGPGPWTFQGGQRLSAHPAAPPPALLSVSGFHVPAEGRAGGLIRGSFEADRSVKARLVLLEGGEATPIAPYRSFLSGQVSLGGRLPELPAGTYRVGAEVTDGIDRIRTPALPVRVSGGARETTKPTASPSPESPSSPGEGTVRAVPPEDGGTGLPWLPLAVAVAVAGGLGAVGLALLVRRRARRAGD